MGRAIKEDEGCGPRSVWEVGQSSGVAEKDSVRDGVFLGEYLKEGRALGSRLFSQRWNAKEEMVGGKGLVEAEGALSRVSSAHACLMEKASRYSILSPSSFCIWRGQNSSSSPFSGVERPLVKVKEGQGAIVKLKESEKELSVNPLRVLLVEERDFEKGDGGSIPKREVGDGVVEEEGKDVESWRYNCLAKFCHCLGMPTKGFEGEILKLLKKMKEKRERFEKVIGKKEERIETL